MNINYNLKELGWNENWQKEFEEFKDIYLVGRVAIEYKGMYKVYCEKGEIFASVSGKMMHSATGRVDYPAVGDWVIIEDFNPSDDRTIIQGVLKRKSKFARKAPGGVFDEQIVASNIDIVFICMALNQNYNLRRLERYVTTAWDSGAMPVAVLTKSDLCDDIEEKLEEVQECAPGIEIICTSSLNKTGFEDMWKLVKPGVTLALLGSSGVGKSTIINELLGENKLETQEVSSIKDKGRHTTTNRELIILPNGGIVIDTPGMRELQVLDVSDGLDTAFDDIETLACNCRFSDCTHRLEPGCAVREAIENGKLSMGRYENYLKLKKEAEFVRRKTDKKAELQHKKQMKDFGKFARNAHKR